MTKPMNPLPWFSAAASFSFISCWGKRMRGHTHIQSPSHCWRVSHIWVWGALLYQLLTDAPNIQSHIHLKKEKKIGGLMCLSLQAGTSRNLTFGTAPFFFFGLFPFIQVSREMPLIEEEKVGYEMQQRSPGQEPNHGYWGYAVCTLTIKPPGHCGTASFLLDRWTQLMPQGVCRMDVHWSQCALSVGNTARGVCVFTFMVCYQAGLGQHWDTVDVRDCVSV